MSETIALLIPSTSKGMNWKTYTDSFLYKLTMKSFILTYDKEHQYKFFIGIDKGDRIYDSDLTKNSFQIFASIMKNIDIEFVYMDGIQKGHLTVMWNRLFKMAYDAGYKYYFQCGDDIEFQTKGWVNDCLKVMKSKNDVGLVGPINNNPRILTQSFVSRNHMELFGYYFPPEIKNWFCDDWINEVYRRLNAFYPLQNHKCENLGGNPRYDINNDPTFGLAPNPKMLEMRNQCTQIVNRDIERLNKKV
jgi:hypothetical protein